MANNYDIVSQKINLFYRYVGLDIEFENMKAQTEKTKRQKIIHLLINLLLINASIFSLENVYFFMLNLDDSLISKYRGEWLFILLFKKIKYSKW